VTLAPSSRACSTPFAPEACRRSGATTPRRLLRISARCSRLRDSTPSSASPGCRSSSTDSTRASHARLAFSTSKSPTRRECATTPRIDCDRVVLHSSQMAVGVYERAGFRNGLRLHRLPRRAPLGKSRALTTPAAGDDRADPTISTSAAPSAVAVRDPRLAPSDLGGAPHLTRRARGARIARRRGRRAGRSGWGLRRPGG